MNPLSFKNKIYPFLCRNENILIILTERQTAAEIVFFTQTRFQFPLATLERLINDISVLELKHF